MVLCRFNHAGYVSKWRMRHRSTFIYLPRVEVRLIRHFESARVEFTDTFVNIRTTVVILLTTVVRLTSLFIYLFVRLSYGKYNIYHFYYTLLTHTLSIYIHLYVYIHINIFENIQTFIKQAKYLFR